MWFSADILFMKETKLIIEDMSAEMTRNCQTCGHFFCLCFNNILKSDLKKSSPISIIFTTMTELQRNAYRKFS